MDSFQTDFFRSQYKCPKVKNKEVIELLKILTKDGYIRRIMKDSNFDFSIPPLFALDF